MSKKSKKFDTENEVTTEATTAVEAQPKAPTIPKAPSLFLRDSSGVEFKFDRRNQLPKKAAAVGEITIDGVATPFQVTSNVGFTTEGHVIRYSWITLPNGQMGYITHDYEVTPVAGEAYTLHEGKANRANPARIAKDDTVGALRIEKFKVTMAARKAAEAQEPVAA